MSGRRAALGAVDRAQTRAIALIRAASPDAEIRWRYRLVLDGLAVVLPSSDLARVASLSGVAAIYPSVRYSALGEPSSVEEIGATALWASEAGGRGRGIKIGIIDDGIDPSHPYFDPEGFGLPPGYPKGDAAFTTAKVIVARAFAPPNADWRYAGRPFDPELSYHGTHVAGIAAGEGGTLARDEGGDGQTISGVAPLAYLGNYKALTVPTASGVGLNGNSPEIVAAIEAAVADGMDVINLSLGEPEVDPDRDAVAKALDNAAAAGVVPVVAAGNDFVELGRGSVSSPGSSARAITVGAVTVDGLLAPFSAAGPTPLGLLPKPDVVAPGVGIVSSVPGGGYETLSGTSMAAPHVAGAVALLLERRPDFTVDQVKSALALTGRTVRSESRGEAPSSRQGGGLVDLREAVDPLIHASPQSLGFGLLDAAGSSATRTITLADAGGGSGVWNVRVVEQVGGAGVEISAPTSVTVPGELAVAVTVDGGAAPGEHAGFLVLERDGESRRLPYWFRVARTLLRGEPSTVLRGTGTYRGDTRGRAALVDTYRYPDAPPPVARHLRGPEQVFRVVLAHPVANLGAAVLGAPRGVRIEPRIVRDSDENRLAGATSLPFVANPYLERFGERVASAAALVPSPGSYAIVFDTPTGGAAGAFRFRVWIDDVTPPTVRLLGRVVRDGRLRARVTDAGAGIDPNGISFRVDDGAFRAGTLDGAVAVLRLTGLRPGTHRLELRVADRQEVKNNENVPSILPNTRIVVTTIRVP